MRQRTDPDPTRDLTAGLGMSVVPPQEELESVSLDRGALTDIPVTATTTPGKVASQEKRECEHDYV